MVAAAAGARSETTSLPSPPPSAAAAAVTGCLPGCPGQGRICSCTACGTQCPHARCGGRRASRRRGHRSVACLPGLTVQQPHSRLKGGRQLERTAAQPWNAWRGEHAANRPPAAPCCKVPVRRAISAGAFPWCTRHLATALKPPACAKPAGLRPLEAAAPLHQSPPQRSGRPLQTTPAIAGRACAAQLLAPAMQWAPPAGSRGDRPMRNARGTMHVGQRHTAACECRKFEQESCPPRQPCSAASARGGAGMPRSALQAHRARSGCPWGPKVLGGGHTSHGHALRAIAARGTGGRSTGSLSRGPAKRWPMPCARLLAAQQA